MIHPSQGAGTLAAQPADDLGGSTEDASTARSGYASFPSCSSATSCSFLDRINIGFAQLQMKQDLGFSDAMYGLGAAVFYVGYVLCEVPSNMLLARFGARRTFSASWCCGDWPRWA
jgi:MFS family permease